MDKLELIQNILQIIIYTLIVGCGTVITKKVLIFLNGKVDELQANTRLIEYEKINKVIDKAQDTITNIVTEINQTFVNDLKKSGEFTKESAKKAKDTAIEEAKILINEESIIVIEETHGSFDKWLNTIIEKTVNELKK